MLSKIPAVVLSGGRSRRMNQKDKALLSVNNKTLLDMSLERLQVQAKRIAINTNSDCYSYKKYGLPVLPDELQGFLGPLAGVLTAMRWAKRLGCRKVLTVAVDTPLFPTNILEKLVSKMKSGKSDIVFAASSSGKNGQIKLHPVFGLWKTDLQESLKIDLREGTRKVLDWSSSFKNSYVVFSKEDFDPFFNVNTPEDLSFLKRTIEER